MNDWETASMSRWSCESQKKEHYSELWRMGLNWVPGVALVEPVASEG